MSNICVIHILYLTSVITDFFQVRINEKWVDIPHVTTERNILMISSDLPGWNVVY